MDLHGQQNGAEEIVVDLPEKEGTTLADYKPAEKPIPQKELAARWVAQAIVVVFGISLTLILVGGFFLIRGMPHENTKLLVTDSIIPFLEKVGTFSTSVFAPLLAFILGYYFGEREAK